jgi:hypothetical protein
VEPAAQRARSDRSGNTGLGHRQVQRWNLPDGWVISARPAHQALVSEADFIAIQGMRAVRDSGSSQRCYLLAGLLRCGLCGRRLESCWAGNRAAYRCRHGHTSAARPDPDRPKNLYIRQDRILPHLPALYLLLSGPDPADWPTTSLPLAVMDVIAHLRARQVTLICDPSTRALRANTREEVKVILDPVH